MSKKWLGALLLLCFSSLLVVGHAAAQTPYTDASLGRLLLSRSDVGTALNAVGSSDAVTTSVDSSPGAPGDLAAAVRVFVTNNGVIVVGLFANSDGSPPNSDVLNLALSGGLLQAGAGSVINNISGFTLGGSAGIGDQDQVVTFSGSVQGTSVNVIGDTFVKGSITCFVFYATPGDTDATVVGAVAQLQAMNLP